ncbi:MAG: tetratricopeptide repeat protein [Gallionellaceae bacterium]
MLKNVTYGFVLLAAMFLSNGVALADDSPTLDQVYQAAHAGKLDDAQRMMDKVLKEHPNSAKAHFVEAELLAKQGQMGNAEEELKNAERLKPDLSFANPQAVQDLKNRIAATHRVSQSPAGSYQAESGDSFPWGMLLLGLGAIAIIVFILRAMNSRNPATFPSNYQPGMRNTSASPMPMQPYGGGMAPMGPAGGGIGSGIMGGLATGAAVGVGMVAGEALAHHFMDGGHSDAGNVAPVADTWGSSSDNMGGSDFGIADNSSWSDNSSFADSGSDVSGGDWG